MAGQTLTEIKRDYWELAARTIYSSPSYIRTFGETNVEVTIGNSYADFSMPLSQVPKAIAILSEIYKMHVNTSENNVSTSENNVSTSENNVSTSDTSTNDVSTNDVSTNPTTAL